MAGMITQKQISGETFPLGTAIAFHRYKASHAAQNTLHADWDGFGDRTGSAALIAPTIPVAAVPQQESTPLVRVVFGFDAATSISSHGQPVLILPLLLDMVIPFRSRVCSLLRS